MNYISFKNTMKHLLNEKKAEPDSQTFSHFQDILK